VSKSSDVTRDSRFVTRQSAGSDEPRVTSHEPRSSASFSWPVRVYWEDTDAGGIVYYANYLKFMERARTEWLRSFGMEQGPLQSEQGLIFVIVDTQVEYKRPAKYGDALTVTASIREHTRASLSFNQQVMRGDELLVNGAIRVACLDAATYRPRGLPDKLVETLLGGRD
jgi:acyl-CoA thioester hydrolase